MSRSDKFLEMYEGFKLGSLGVSRKPKVTVEPEEPKPRKSSVTPKKGVTVIEKTRGSSRKFPSIKWTETIESSDPKFGHLVSEDFPILDCDMYDAKGLNAVVLRYLNMFKTGDNQWGSRNHGFWKMSYPKSSDDWTRQSDKVFLTKLIKAAEKGGLAAIFPEYDGRRWEDVN
jgi:hypothetical protein